MAPVITVLVTALLLGAFLLGSIPFGFLLYRLATGGDIRRTGSGNIGATNVLRSGGRRLGVLTLALDAGKGALAVALAAEMVLRWAPPAAPWAAPSAALAVIVGHMYSPWLGWHGGKGVATALGAFAVLTPWALLAAAVVFALVFAGWRYVSLASIAACVALPLVLLIRATPAPAATEAVAAAAAVLIIARHRANIGRLWRGAESGFGRAPGGNGGDGGNAHGAAK